jgi:cell division protein FtsI (penicillin-binding protein 3)
MTRKASPTKRSAEPAVRVGLVAALAVVWMLAATLQLGRLQLVEYGAYLERARRQQQRMVEVSPPRGILYDRNGRELAVSIQVDSAFAVPAEIPNPYMAARLLAPVLGVSPEEIETRLSRSRSFVWLARKLPADTAEQIKALNLSGVYFQKENRRFYPKRDLAAHVLGFVDIDEKGLAGIEYSLDEEIRGQPVRMLVLADARRRWYDRNGREPQPGASVVLTLDDQIQYIAEKELRAAIRATRAQAGTVIVQDPATGEILALANWPSFNPNAPQEAREAARMNRAVSAVYEPGSIFKIVTLAAAFEENLTRTTELIDCQNGAIYIAGHRIRDHKPFGLLNVAQVLARSSDVGAIKLGLRVGPRRLHQYIRAFGFGQPTGIELSGESRGLLRPVENWTPVSVGSISMGQEVGVTSVQMVTAMSAIANGGLLVPPRLVRELRRNNQVTVPQRPAPVRVVSATTAATLRRLLEGVVLEGTGQAARLDGWTSAGKTGTAQKIDPATGRYSLTDHIAGYVGFAPLNQPAITVLVVLDSPPGEYHGGKVAAPVFKKIAEQTLAYLGVPHDVIPPVPLERARLRLPDADQLSDFHPLQRVSAAAAEPETEPVLQRTAETARATTMAFGEAETIAVPALEGKTVRAVTELCVRLGLTPVLIGTGVAREQVPAAGEHVPRGSRITVRFARNVPARTATESVRDTEPKGRD